MHEMSQSEPALMPASTDRIRWGWVALTVVALEIALIMSAIVWVAIYAYLINPGHDPGYYQNYAQVSSPIVSVTLGIPYVFFLCRWVGRKAGMRAVAMCLSVWLVMVTIDVLLILMSGGLTVYMGAMIAISHVTKMLAAYFGGKAALRDVLIIRRAAAE